MSSSPHGLVGSLLGVYRVEQLVGAGGMGEVYRGTDTRLDRRVAIKVLRPGPQRAPTGAGDSSGSAHAIASLNHPSICTLHDVGVHGGIDYMVMEYVKARRWPAGWLANRLAMDRVIWIRHRDRRCSGRCSHPADHHRDLKPANIILTKRASRCSTSASRSSWCRPAARLVKRRT